MLVSFSREGKTEEESVRHQQVASKENNEQTEDLFGFLNLQQTKCNRDKSPI